MQVPKNRNRDGEPGARLGQEVSNPEDWNRWDIFGGGIRLLLLAQAAGESLEYADLEEFVRHLSTPAGPAIRNRDL